MLNRVTFALILICVSSSGTYANYDRARASFLQLPASERAIVQWNLTWSGDYNGLADGEFGRRTYEAIRAFQAGSGYRANGVLTGAQLKALERRSFEIMDLVGFQFTDDSRSRLRLGIPFNLVQVTETTRRGTRWRSASDDFVVETISMPYSETSFIDLFRRLGRSNQVRTVSYKVIKDDFFVVTGTYRDKSFYSRMRRSRGATRGVTISWQPNLFPGVNGIVLALADSVFNLKETPETEPSQTEDRPVFLVIGSRSTQREAIDFARLYADGFEHTEVYRTTNGFYAIALGVIEASVADEIRSILVTADAIPQDSYLSSGQNFESSVWNTDGLRVASPDSTDKGEESDSGASGTGFFVTSDGIMLTNAHVVGPCKKIRVPPYGIADLLQLDKTNDLALIRVETEETTASAKFQKAPLRVGAEIVVLGYPLASLLGSTLNVTSGEVNSLSGIGGDTRYFQMSAPVQPGNSGGPVLDMTGRVVGVAAARIDDLAVISMFDAIPQNINFAIRSEALRAFLRSSDIAFASEDARDVKDRTTIAEDAAKFTAQVVCAE